MRSAVAEAPPSPGRTPTSSPTSTPSRTIAGPGHTRRSAAAAIRPSITGSDRRSRSLLEVGLQQLHEGLETAEHPGHDLLGFGRVLRQRLEAGLVDLTQELLVLEAREHRLLEHRDDAVRRLGRSHEDAVLLERRAETRDARLLVEGRRVLDDFVARVAFLRPGSDDEDRLHVPGLDIVGQASEREDREVRVAP